MNLSEKLRAFIGSSKSKEREADLGNQKSRLQQRSEKDRQLLEILDADIVSTPCGDHVIIEKLFDKDFVHGGIKLDSIFTISRKILGLIGKDRSFEELDLQKTVFIDTETTGLAGGTGTYAFLIGIGFFTRDGFKIVQFLMRDFDEEASLLYNLKDILSNFNSLVSFNGKAFDIPLLRTRFLINGMKIDSKEFLHLDLLFSARRLYRERLQSVSLSSLEQNVMKVERYGDIPGFKIPSIYFKYLQDKNPIPLKPVVYHNKVDILSLVALFSILADGMEDPFSSKRVEDQDMYCLARVYEDMGYINDSIKCYKKAMKVTGVKDKACLKLSLLYKRHCHWKEAERLWLKMANSNVNAIFSLIELAKYYEHKVKDYKKAEYVTLKAIDLYYKKTRMLRNFSYDELEDLKKRLNRVRSKTRKNVTQQKT